MATADKSADKTADKTVQTKGTLLHQWLGIRWVTLDATTGTDDGEPGSVVIEMDMRDDLRGPAGSLEGGVVSTLADVAGASAGAMAARRMVATEHISISFLAPGRQGPIRASGTPLRVGRNDAVAEVRIVDTGRDDRLMAVALVTVRLLDELGPDRGSVAASDREVGAGSDGRADGMEAG